MVKLIIEQPGLTVYLTGMSPTRTPVEIDISRMNLNLVLSELRSQAIDNYKIHSDIVIQNRKKQTKKIIVPKKEVDLTKKIENLELLLYQLLEKESNSKTIIKEIIKEEPFKKVKKKKDDIDEETFIPSISTTGLKVEGQFTTQSTEKDDIIDQVNLLKKLNR